MNTDGLADPDGCGLGTDAACGYLMSTLAGLTCGRATGYRIEIEARSTDERLPTEPWPRCKLDR